MCGGNPLGGAMNSVMNAIEAVGKPVLDVVGKVGDTVGPYTPEIIAALAGSPLLGAGGGAAGTIGALAGTDAAMGSGIADLAASVPAAAAATDAAAATAATDAAAATAATDFGTASTGLSGGGTLAMPQTAPGMYSDIPPGAEIASPSAAPSAPAPGADPWSLKSLAPKNLSEALKLGGTGMGLVNILGANKGPTVPSDPYGTGAAAATTATNILNKFNTGQLMPTDQAAVSQWHDQALASAKSYYAQAGLGDSSISQQAYANIAQQADQMRQSALNNMLTQANTAAGISNPIVANMVSQQIAADKNLQTAQSSFSSALMQYGMQTTQKVG